MKQYRIEEICEVVSGGTPSTKVANYWDGDILWLTPKDLSSSVTKWICSSSSRITKEGLDNSAARMLPINTVLLSSRAPIGYLALAGKPLCTNQGFKSMICNTNYILPEYLYYYLQTKVEELNNISTGSTFKELSGSLLKNFVVNIHNIATQQHIVDILGILDEKIENNSKILNELNNLIQLEFEKTILANSSEKRLLADVFAFQEGPGIRNWQYVDKGINFINIRCINDGDIDTSSMNKISEQEAYGIYKHFLLNEWDLVMSMSGTLGRYAIVGKEHLPLCLNTSVIRFYPKNDFTYYSYMYAYLTSKDFIASITTLANGSAQQNVGPTHLKKVTIKLPNEEVIKQFHQRVFPLINRMVSLRGDNQKIKELKEYYLKKFFG